jgi:hypothetical protein
MSNSFVRTLCLANSIPLSQVKDFRYFNGIFLNTFSNASLTDPAYFPANFKIEVYLSLFTLVQGISEELLALVT